MSFYKLAKARTAELERPEKKLRTDYGESKRVDVAKYHDELTKGKVKQNYDSIISHHHDKLNHSDYLISQTNLGKTDLLKNKLLSERMAQLNATKFQPVQEVDINLGIGSDNAVVQEVNQVIGDFIQKISSGVFDLTMTNDLYKLYKLIQTQTYKFGSDLLERYKSYFEDVRDTLNLDETADVVRSYSRKDSSVLDLMIKIVDNSIQIIDKMLDAIVKGKSSDERKQILEQDVKNITFKKIDRTYLKELSDEIKNLEKSKKSEKDARKNAKTQALLEQLKNIEKVARMSEMQKQGLFLQEERQREIEAETNQQMMEQEQEMRDFNEEQRRVEEEQRQVEEARRETEENRGMAEEEGRTRFVNAQEEEERQRIMRIREDRLQRERERREEAKAREEDRILKEYERLAGRAEQLDRELNDLISSKKQINDNLLPVLVQSIKELFPESSSRTIKRQVNDYIADVQEEKGADNTFLAEVKEKSAEAGADLEAIAKALVQLDIEELRNRQEMNDVSVKIDALPKTVDDAIDDRVEELFDDMDADLVAEPAAAAAPAPEPAPKPKKEETAKVKKLYETSQYSSNENEIRIFGSSDVFFRKKEKFIESQKKPALINLLNKLGINYNKWSSTTKGDSQISVQAFRTKAWDILKDNPRLKLKGGSHWFKTPK